MLLGIILLTVAGIIWILAWRIITCYNYCYREPPIEPEDHYTESPQD